MGDDIVRATRNCGITCLDGFAKVKEYAERQNEIDQKYLCITDHGVMGAVPQQVKYGEEYSLSPIFGCELYVNEMQPKVETRYESAEIRKQLSDEEKKKFDKSNHLLAIAYTSEGYSNLVKLTSWAWIHGFYRKPRVNHDALNQFKDGIIFTTTCGNSEIANAFFNGGDDAGFQMLDKYIDMFGPDNFYLELMMLDWVKQKPYDAFLIRAHEKYGLPLILSQDCFVVGTKILTKTGFKNIEEVQVGDMVLTDKGRWRKVEVTGSRSVRDDEKVFRVKTKVGTYAYEGTESHEVSVANRRGKEWKKTWKSIGSLTSEDYLLIPKIKSEFLFSSENLDEIDLMQFFVDYDFQFGESYDSDNKGNMSCRLQYNEQNKEFWSYRGWDRKYKTTIPRFLKVDEDFLKVIGWYIAEGWSEKKSNQVGFALHKKEQHIADWLISYFSKYGILAKTYKVSKEGIAVRFSSVVFNKFFGSMCGYGAENKHMPCPDGQSWLNKWSRDQILLILSKYWQGDGSGNDKKTQFASVSKNLIFEIASIFNGLGMFVYPFCETSKKETWNNSWRIVVCENKTKSIDEWFNGSSENFEDPRVRGTKYFELEDDYAIQIKDVFEIEYESEVYCFQVEEDHTFTAGLYSVSNCHYCKKEHSHNQRLMLMQQNRRTIDEINALIESGEADDLFELQDTNLWLKSEDELNMKWETDYQEIIDYELYKQAKANTIKVCERTLGVEIDRSIKLPKIPDAERILLEEIKNGFKARHCPNSPKYLARLKEEYELICEKGFASYFLIQKQMTDEARRIGPEILGFGDGSECVGPGRGSACGSLVAYCLRLHDVEPIHHDLKFSRFLSPARGGKQLRIRHTIQPVPHGEVKL